MILIRKSLLRMVALLVLALALMSVAASCDGDGGMYQGGNDSSPNWR